jgi:uncharacterized BrkB/YihY/UPF0761 family membrane protein
LLGQRRVSDVVMVAILSVALLVGLVGFAVHVLWIAAIVVLGLGLGYVVANARQDRRTHSLQETPVQFVSMPCRKIWDVKSLRGPPHRCRAVASAIGVLVLVVGIDVVTTIAAPASSAYGLAGHVESGTPGPDAVTAVRHCRCCAGDDAPRSGCSRRRGGGHP